MMIDLLDLLIAFKLSDADNVQTTAPGEVKFRCQYLAVSNIYSAICFNSASDFLSKLSLAGTGGGGVMMRTVTSKNPQIVYHISKKWSHSICKWTSYRSKMAISKN